MILQDAFKFKTVTSDQDKTTAPEETVKRFREKLKTLDLDILKGTKRIDNGRLDIPIFFSVCGKDAIAVTKTGKQMGKGASPQQAEASAVMELAERFSFFSFCENQNKFFYDTYKNVKHKAITFETIAQSVHDNSDDLDISKKIFENMKLKWTKAFNLTANKEIVIPFDWFFAINQFNGTSAGNCTEEAVSQGICEVTERHVCSVISENKVPAPLINPDSATDPMVVEMLRKYKNAGINLYISDFSLNTGIPSVGVLAYDPLTFPEKSEIVWTAGTTPDPQKALSRALSETAQLAGDFNTGSNYMASGLPKFLNIQDAGFIINQKNRVNITDLPDISHNNIKIEVENCVQALARQNMQVIVVNTTHPKLNVPAFYSIVPGARFRERTLKTSVGMFLAKLITENSSPETGINQLKQIDRILTGKYYIKFYIGLCYLTMNQNEKALDFFTNALDLDPGKQDMADIYSYMGLCLKNMEKYKHALHMLKKGESIDNQRTDIYNLMGFCYFKLQEHEKAIACFKKILELDPGSAIDYANIASNYRDMGNRKKAIEYYEAALALDPSIDFALENLIRLGQI
jgi:ribosomal protein S12 methylthiotransferase accessory factor